jgi:hypothetical protein
MEVAMAEKTVDNYIAQLEEWQGEIVSEVRRIILNAAPEALESIKWAQPVYEINGPFAYIKAFKKAVNFGFWRGAEINDPQVLLQGSGEKMRHFKIGKLEDINETVFTDYVQQAVKLNLTKGDPTRS